MIDQLNVCLPAGPGRLARTCRVLGESGVQIHGVMVASNTDFAIVRLVVDRPQATCEMLCNLGYDASTCEAAALRVDNVPGGLAVLLDRLHSSDLTVAYAYSCSVNGGTVDIVRVQGEPVELKLRGSGLTLVEAGELYALDEA